MTRTKYKSWLARVGKLSMKKGYYLFYDGHLIENPEWAFSSQIILSTGNTSYILHDSYLESDPDHYDDMKKRLKVMIEVIP